MAFSSCVSLPVVFLINSVCCHWICNSRVLKVTQLLGNLPYHNDIVPHITLWYRASQNDEFNWIHLGSESSMLSADYKRPTNVAIEPLGIRMRTLHVYEHGQPASHTRVINYQWPILDRSSSSHMTCWKYRHCFVIMNIHEQAGFIEQSCLNSNGNIFRKSRSV